MDEHARDLDQTDIERAAKGNFDPAPSPVDLAHQRSAQLMDNLTTQALDQLRQFRDDTDGLMIALTKRHDAIVSAIDEHASRVAQVIAAKEIMAEQTQKMKEMFAPVQAVMTQQENVR